MRIGEECPYITPCGFCSRQLKPCEKKGKLERVIVPDISPATEELRKLSERLKAEAEEQATGSRKNVWQQ